MANKIDKLNELGELYKSGAITNDEFESLKTEILNGSNISNDEQSVTKSLAIEEKIGKEKISLKSFIDNDNSKINPPNVEYLNLKDIPNNELKLLKPFVRSKQIYAPSEMTEDEIKICNKIFSVQEIAEMNSERSGFNYALMSISSALSAGFSLFLTNISPCLLIFSSTLLVSSICFSIFILSRVDATKLDKTVSYLALALDVISIILIFTWKP
ncbi:SHOCT domain-containing protein [Flavobacterium sp.]|uniref:SHOCT domain-containing protein n=1 Tax=Flavobacterium sp. TaxID=239 RepID=UPI003751521C